MTYNPNVEPPVEIAALRKRAVDQVDPMRPGAGTPWENRGSEGVLPAFFKTCFLSMFAPAKLCCDLRRPETATDVNVFNIGCGICWGLGWAINAVIVYFQIRGNKTTDATVYFGGTFGQFLLGIVLSVVALRFMTMLYYKLVVGGSAAKFPQVLVHNVLGYAMGPSLLALVPIAGVPLAAVWTLVSMIVGGRARLRVTLANAVVCALLPMLAACAMIAGGYFVVNWLWYEWTGGGIPAVNGLTPDEIAKLVKRTTPR